MVKNILDIGAGNAYFIFLRALKHPDELYTGLDIRPENITLATPQGVYDSFRHITVMRAIQEAGECQDFHAFFAPIRRYMFRRNEYYRFREASKALYNPYAEDEKRSYSEILDQELDIILADAHVADAFDWHLGHYVDMHRDSAVIYTVAKNMCFSKPLYEVLTEPMPDHVASALDQYCSRISMVKADGAKLPFLDASFDTVFMNNIPRSEVPRIHPEARRVSKTGTVLTYNEVPLNEDAVPWILQPA